MSCLFSTRNETVLKEDDTVVFYRVCSLHPVAIMPKIYLFMSMPIQTFKYKTPPQ